MGTGKVRFANCAHELLVHLLDVLRELVVIIKAFPTGGTINLGNLLGFTLLLLLRFGCVTDGAVYLEVFISDMDILLMLPQNACGFERASTFFTEKFPLSLMRK